MRKRRLVLERCEVSTFAPLGFRVYGEIWVVPKIRGPLFRGPHNKDYSILGSILGSPYFGKLPYEVGLQPNIKFHPSISKDRTLMPPF